MTIVIAQEKNNVLVIVKIEVDGPSTSAWLGKSNYI